MDIETFLQKYHLSPIEYTGLKNTEYAGVKKDLEELIGDTHSSEWVEYIKEDRSTHPKSPKGGFYGRLFVRRKNGKVHWEVWNGSGWAYNNAAITHYLFIRPPKGFEITGVGY